MDFSAIFERLCRKKHAFLLHCPSKMKQIYRKEDNLPLAESRHFGYVLFLTSFANLPHLVICI